MNVAYYIQTNSLVKAVQKLGFASSAWKAVGRRSSKLGVWI